MSDTALDVSARSKKVRGYVKAVLEQRKAQAKFDKIAPKYDKARVRLERASDAVRNKRAALSGGQMAAAERLLASPAIETLAKPCKEAAG